MAKGDWGAGLNSARNALCVWISYDDTQNGLIVGEILEYNRTNFVFVNGSLNGRKQFPWQKFRASLCNNEIRAAIEKDNSILKDSKKLYGWLKKQ